MLSESVKLKIIDVYILHIRIISYAVMCLETSIYLFLNGNTMLNSLSR